MNPLSPNQILRNLTNGYFMTHKEQEEAATYIRKLKEDIKTLDAMVMHQAEEIMALSRELNMWKSGKL